MSIHYLIDENVTPLYKRQLLTNNSEIRVYAVGDPGCPSICGRHKNSSKQFMIFGR
jgi:hypothetical protein